MKSKALILLVLSASISAFAQRKKPFLKELDSIYQKKWEAAMPTIDSLENPTYIKIGSRPKDSLIVREKPALTAIPYDEIPITPYGLMKNPNRPSKWLFYGQNNLTFNQSSFSNWNAGGNDNIGVIARLNYNLIYKYSRHYLENTFKFGYGLVDSEGQATRKTEDYINIMTNYGYEIGQSYYLSTGFQFISQFTRGYNYAATPDPKKDDRISKFMSPAYLNLGLGISYNPQENLQVIFRPLNGQFTFVTDPLLQKAGKYGLEKDGQNLRAELGARLNILYRFKIYKDILFTHQLNLFANYLTHTERVDIAYTGVINMKFNKYLNANISLDLTYDHDQIKKLQRKQTLGIGLSYNLGSETKSKNAKLLKPVGFKQ